MPREGDKWRVRRGDCLWNIAKSVYGNGTRWTEIADANGISRSRPIIYPNQLFTLPGITAGSSSPAPAPAPSPPPAYTHTPNIVWFTLRAGTEREMQVIWEQSHNKFQIRWEIWDLSGHLWLESEETVTTSDRQKAAEHSFANSTDRYVCRFSVRAIDDKGNALSGWGIKEYDFRNNPPTLPPDPEINIDKNNSMTVTLTNIDKNINADSIEIAIYQDDTLKYKTGKVSINKETNFAKYVTTVDPGHYYKVRCRAVRGSLYGGWTNFTSNDQSCPKAPSKITTLRVQSISDQGNKTYNVFIEWDEEKTAKTYEVQWTTNVEYFDKSSQVSSQTTEEGKGPRALITDIATGHEYFFRVRSINDKGNSVDWSAIKSLKVGSKPSAPTTWSNVTSAVLGEDLNLYWAHNATDGSLERYARLYLKIIDSAHPEKEPQEIYKVIENTKPEGDQNQNSVYTINTNNDEWKGLEDGFTVKWKVQTAGISNDYSDWSTEREVNMYAKPSLILDILNKDQVSIEEINRYPFYFNVGARPATQTPISYYIEIISNSGYTAVDNVGQTKVVNPGDKIYQKYYDPTGQVDPWRFLLELTPGNIDLQNNMNYTVNITVSMNSGLDAIASATFNVIFDQTGYAPYGDIIVDSKTLTASIHPYCMESYEEDGETKQKLSENCTLSVYRRDYDGTFTEIATGIENKPDIYVVDPHPSLDYARYRVVAITKDTGFITYCDIKAVEVGEPAIVMQWSEEWSKFDYDPTDEDSKLEVAWAGSMLKLPYNVDVSESNTLDVSLVEYVGRQHPVSYYGTQQGQTGTWNTDIPAEDKELIYALRRLAKWAGDVYVREPSGTGYWAHVTVSFSKKHLDLVIPVSITVTRVEGGI